MQVVIEIPEEAYNLLKGDGVDWLGAEHILSCVAEGKVLPKGHGDLIDRSKIAFDYWSVDNYVCVSKRNIFEMPVIVSAEKE